MTEVTLESLAKRVDDLEQKFAEREARKKDWRRSVGMFEGSEFMKQVDEEIAAMREAERQAACDGYEDYVFVVQGVPSGRRDESKPSEE